MKRFLSIDTVPRMSHRKIIKASFARINLKKEVLWKTSNGKYSFKRI